MDKDLLVWCVIMLAGFYGWVNNIITLFGISDVWSASLLHTSELAGARGSLCACCWYLYGTSWGYYGILLMYYDDDELYQNH